ncbi:thioredoxin domain-containing protein [Neorhodopirellula lusitana]|uniref:thioredoxin domain-containing protein n=1 Tax=Neorhodopirellula lusitana TaxID=445327 RepID=UPI00384B3892
MPNSLAESLSPYLLQHQDNPVNWVAWGPEAFETAKARDVPVFLSVGYAACHWCHVMAHESFENEEVGAYLNEHFVCIKVDREERPDIDQIYMNAVQLMTGHGGWPMSVFMDHDGRPFYSGTYWPLHSRSGMPGFPQVLEALVDAWTNRRSDIADHAGEITDALAQLAVGTGTTSKDVPGADRVGVAVESLLKSVDQTWGGFGSAPKFPHATDLDLMLRVAVRTGDSRLTDAAELTLDRMAAGGIRDHIGGGFSRYSVDGHWLVPHFEKMLYDNGLLAEVYTRAFQVTGNQRHADVAAEILTYLQRDMIDAGQPGGLGGGIHCSEDADSEGVEGKFYVWHPSEVFEVLGEERGSRFCAIYDISERGNFEGSSIPNLRQSIAKWAEQSATDQSELQRLLDEDKETLRLHRATRIAPGRDDKIVVAWNGLAIRAFAIAGVVLGREDFISTATNAARFALSEMRDADGRLLHVYRSGTAHLPGYVDDYAILADALLALYEATADQAWLAEAVTLAEQIVAHFQDSEAGGFYYTADDSEQLITRIKDWHDGSLVSGNASAAMVLLKLSRLTTSDWTSEVEATLRCGETVIREQSRACSALISVLDELHHGGAQLVVAVNHRNTVPEIAEGVLAKYQPGQTTAWHVADDTKQDAADPSATINPNLLANKTALGERVTLYRCHDFQCDALEIDP